MVSFQHSLHSDVCFCTDCVRLREIQNSVPENPYRNINEMSRKNSHDEDGYETASDSESSRAKKDKAISQAPYLPKIQVWARADGPYTLRIGNQWVHCDDLIVNGTEYRDGVSKSGGSLRSDKSISQKRPGPSRAQSYVRSRPQKSATYPQPNISPRTSNDTVESASRYPLQSLPMRSKDDSSRRERRDSAISMNSERGNQNAMVPYTPARPQLDRKPSRQGAMRSAIRARPGTVRRGSSYEIPVRSRSRKSVAFAPLPRSLQT